MRLDAQCIGIDKSLEHIITLELTGTMCNVAITLFQGLGNLVLFLVSKTQAQDVVLNPHTP